MSPLLSLSGLPVAACSSPSSTVAAVVIVAATAAAATPPSPSTVTPPGALAQRLQQLLAEGGIVHVVSATARPPVGGISRPVSFGGEDGSAERSVPDSLNLSQKKSWKPDISRQRKGQVSRVFGSRAMKKSDTDPLLLLESTMIERAGRGGRGGGIPFGRKRGGTSLRGFLFSVLELGPHPPLFPLLSALNNGIHGPLDESRRGERLLLLQKVASRGS